MTAPTGLLIGRDPRNLTWRVGKKIGEGVCGTVHKLERVNSSEKSKFAIKLAPLPGSAKGAKKKTLERNANLLNMEKLMYTAQLNSLRGTFIPKIPTLSGPPEFGEVEGYRFLVMEKMEASLFDLVPSLLASVKGGKISFGEAAARLVECIEAIHQHHLLSVDVKPENFMLAKNGKTLPSKIRMIDLGLLQDMRSLGGMRPNEAGKTMAGTPLYASLNVHDGNTIGPRDDLEAIGYVIGELILALQAAARGDEWEDADLLPWSTGTSDEHIHELKRRELTSTRSSFFSAMSRGDGNDHVERIMREYFHYVQNLGYKAKPDYDMLRGLLSDLDLVVKKPKKRRSTSEAATGKAKTGRAKKPPASSTEPGARSRRSTRSSSTKKSAGAKRPSPGDSDSDWDFGEDAPSKSRRTSRRRVNDDDDSSEEEEEEDFVTCLDGSDAAESMDWESVEQDENKEPVQSGLGIKLVFIEGPHKGKSFALIEGQSETMVLGSRPAAKNDNTFQLDGEGVDASHAKLVLKADKRFQKVNVVDLKSKAGTFVNGDRIPKGKDRMAFKNDTIQIGDSKMKVSSLKSGASSKKKAARAPSVASDDEEEAVMQEADNVGVSSGPRIKIEFVEGPSKSESIVFQQGELEILTLGSDPTAKKGETHVLRGGSVDASHARLELTVNRNFPMLTVYDLKSKSGTYVNKDEVAKGKDRAAFRGDRIRIGKHVMVIKSA